MARDKKINLGFDKEVKHNKVNLVILGNLDFPNGSAPTARIHSYAKCILEFGGSVNILCLRAWLKSDVNISTKGSYDEIEYIYTPGSQYRSNSFIKRRLLEIKGMINGITYLNKLNNENKVTAILYFTTTWLNEIIFTLFSKIKNIPVVRELNEYPHPYAVSLKEKFWAYSEVKLRTKLYDGIIVISRFLDAYYNSSKRKNCKSIHIPILVDAERFNLPKNITNYGRYIAYVGTMSIKKDGVDILIKAFSLIANKYPEVKLMLIGNNSNGQENKYLNNLIQKHSLEQRVLRIGHIKMQDIPFYLINATLLCLSRPSSLQALGGFPTKLGEYLVTGNPVVVTRVGEIYEYLQDGISVLFAEPDSVESFAEKIEFALMHPEVAKSLGLNGKAVAMKHFYYKSQSTKMNNYFLSLNQ